MTLKIKRLTPTAVLPAYAHETDTGMDIRSDEDVYVESHTFKLIKTGIAVELPRGYGLQLRPRSGLAAKQGVRAVLGTIDEGYRGEIGVTLFTSYREIEVKRGDRIGQLVVEKVERAEIVEEDEISSDTERGTNGFGSTGVK